jgi:hypothetical protein
MIWWGNLKERKKSVGRAWTRLIWLSQCDERFAVNDKLPSEKINFYSSRTTLLVNNLSSLTVVVTRFGF